METDLAGRGDIVQEMGLRMGKHTYLFIHNSRMLLDFTLHEM